MKKCYNRVLTIAGSDSGGGAGIQADIKTIQSLGCYATTAVTAVTVQNTMGVSDVFPIPADVVGAQVKAVLDDIGTDTIKIGMLHSAATVGRVAELLSGYKINNVVLDPVMVSTSGHRLLDEDGVRMMVERLIPQVRVVTPNIPEAELLLGGRLINTIDELPGAARALAERFGVSVLLKSGHVKGDRLVDYLYDVEQDVLVELASTRVDTRNTHGTGCTLSSALASLLARGLGLQDAAKGAKAYINDAIAKGAEYDIGHGHGPLWLFGDAPIPGIQITNK